MRTRRVTACTFLLLAFALGFTACGGGARSKQAAAAQARAATHWRIGLTQWHRQMLHALYGVSVLFSTDRSLAELASGQTRAGKALAGFERTLASCATTVERLGREPEGLAPARRYALEACKSLQLGESLIEVAVKRIEQGFGADLSEASGPLSDGQTGVETAANALRAAPSP